MKKGDIVWAWSHDEGNAHIGIYVESSSDNNIHFVQLRKSRNMLAEFAYVKPYTPSRIVKDPVSIMKVLVDKEYFHDSSLRGWSKEGMSYIWYDCMWDYCGKEAPDYFYFEEEWLE